MSESVSERDISTRQHVNARSKKNKFNITCPCIKFGVLRLSVSSIEKSDGGQGLTQTTDALLAEIPRVDVRGA